MKYIKRFMVIGLAVMGLIGCGGAPKEKIEEAQSVYAQLVTRHNEVIEAYAGVEDDSYSKTLNEMSDKINAVGQKELKDFSEEEIDAIIEDLQSNLSIYDEIMTSVEASGKEQKERKGIAVTIKNNTSVNLYELYLYQKEDESEKQNLVADMGYLGGYDTFNIVQFYLDEEDETVVLEALDESGNMIESGEIDMSDVGEDGITIKMEYSFETMEGELIIE